MQSDNPGEYTPEILKDPKYIELLAALRAACAVAPEDMRILAMKTVMREVDPPVAPGEHDKSALVRAIITNYTLKLTLPEALGVFWSVAGVSSGIASKPKSVLDMYSSMI